MPPAELSWKFCRQLHVINYRLFIVQSNALHNNKVRVYLQKAMAFSFYLPCAVSILIVTVEDHVLSYLNKTIMLFVEGPYQNVGYCVSNVSFGIVIFSYLSKLILTGSCLLQNIFHMVVEVPRWTNAKMEVQSFNIIVVYFVITCCPHLEYIWLAKHLNNKILNKMCDFLMQHWPTTGFLLSVW